jgi:hypothetical protein
MLQSCRKNGRISIDNATNLMDREWKTRRMAQLEGIYEAMGGISFKEGHRNVESRRMTRLCA